MLKIDNLTVSYGTTRAVRGISFEVGDAEAVALLGPNAAGKTSTLRAISGLTPAHGSVQLDGQEQLGQRPDVIARSGLIHVPEGRQVFGDLTVHENLEVGATARGHRRAQFTSDDVYSLFPALIPLNGRLGYALSGGEQQMLALGRALVGAPVALMVDEPSLGLAPLVAAIVSQALVEIKSRIAIIIVEQNVRMALGICDRALVLSEGEIVLQGIAAEMRDQSTLLASYLGQRRTGVGA